MMVRAGPFPHRKTCLKIWLSVLFILSYGLLIFFTLYVRKRTENLTESLERFVLPPRKDELPPVEGRAEKGFGGSRKERVRWIDKTRENSHFSPSNDKTRVFQGDNIAHGESSGNETELRIVSFPDENQTHFATFGLTTPRADDYFYAFCAPLAVRAWKRIGYDSIVFIVGDENEWRARPLLRHIYMELVSLHPVIIFLKAKQDNEILISQASRLFAANYFSWKKPNSTFIVTSDVDLWPLNAATFDIPKDKVILSLNSDCCGSFQHGSHTYKLIPLGNVVANVKTWRELMNVHGFFPKSVPEILDYFFRDFGPLALERTRKDEYVGWYMDQRIISMRLDAWMAQNGGKKVQFVGRDVGRDRLDVNYWVPFSLYGKNDIHVLPGAYKPGIWEKVRHLFRLMYSKDEEYKVVEYREMFMKHYMDTRKYSWQVLVPSLFALHSRRFMFRDLFKFCCVQFRWQKPIFYASDFGPKFGHWFGMCSLCILTRVANRSNIFVFWLLFIQHNVLSVWSHIPEWSLMHLLSHKANFVCVYINCIGSNKTIPKQILKQKQRCWPWTLKLMRGEGPAHPNPRRWSILMTTGVRAPAHPVGPVGCSQFANSGRPVGTSTYHFYQFCSLWYFTLSQAENSCMTLAHGRQNSCQTTPQKNSQLSIWLPHYNWLRAPSGCGVPRRMTLLNTVTEQCPATCLARTFFLSRPMTLRQKAASKKGKNQFTIEQNSLLCGQVTDTKFQCGVYFVTSVAKYCCCCNFELLSLFGAGDWERETMYLHQRSRHGLEWNDVRILDQDLFVVCFNPFEVLPLKNKIFFLNTTLSTLKVATQQNSSTESLHKVKITWTVSPFWRSTMVDSMVSTWTTHEQPEKHQIQSRNVQREHEYAMHCWFIPDQLSNSNSTNRTNFFAAFKWDLPSGTGSKYASLTFSFRRKARKPCSTLRR